MVADERQYEVVLQANRAARRVDDHVIDANFLHGAVEEGFNIAVLDTVLQVGLDPVLDVVMDLRTTIYERNAGAVPPKVERRNRRRVLPANHQHITIKVRMRLAVVMRNLGEI